MIPLNWTPVANNAGADTVVAPHERLSWPRTVGLGAQHVVAMFGATFLVPVLTGFPPATTLLFSGVGTLPFNTDGGGLCNNHPANRGGITKVIEAVRQLRGEAHPKVQVPDCTLALAQGTGGLLGSRHGSATLIMERQ